MSTENAIYDIPALKDQIGRLKVQKLKLSEEKSKLESDLMDYESRLQVVRQELNILGAVDNLRFAEGKNQQEMKVQDVATYNISEKKIFLADKKLEYSILNSEIKNSLTRLEKEAIASEENLYLIESQLKKLNNDFHGIPNNLKSNKSDHQLEMSKSSLNKANLSDQLRKESDSKKLKRTKLQFELTKLRSEWSLIEDECILMSEQSRRLQQSYEGEMVRLDVLLQCYRDVKAQFLDLSKDNDDHNDTTTLHGDNSNKSSSRGSGGWAKDVFIDATGSLETTITSPSQLINVLLPWCLPITATTTIDELNAYSESVLTATILEISQKVLSKGSSNNSKHKHKQQSQQQQRYHSQKTDNKESEGEDSHENSKMDDDDDDNKFQIDVTNFIKICSELDKLSK